MPQSYSYEKYVREVRKYDRESLLRAVAGVTLSFGDRPHMQLTRTDGYGMIVSLHILGRLAQMTAVHGRLHGRPASNDDVIWLCHVTQSLKEPILSNPSHGDVQGMLVRMSWDQMPYQHSPYFDFDVWQGLYTRTSGPDAEVLRSAWDRTFSLPPKNWYIAVKVLWVIGLMFNQFHARELEAKLVNVRSASDLVFKVLPDLSLTAREIRTRFLASPIAKGFERYAFNPLTSHPILEYSLNKFVIPTPRHYGNAVGMGTLYRLSGSVGDNSVLDSFGPVFEQYVGKLLGSAFPGKAIYEESTYIAKTSWAGFDWVVDAGPYCLLIECRSGRIPQGVRSVADLDELKLALVDKYGKTILRYPEKIRHIEGGLTPVPSELMKKNLLSK